MDERLIPKSVERDVCRRAVTRPRRRLLACAHALARGAALVLACAPLALAPTTPAIASDTQWWSTGDADDYASAEARGLVVGADGTIELGPAAVVSSVDSLDVIWAVAALPGGGAALAGNGGRIMRWTASQGARPWVTLPVGQVLCLAKDGADLIAGTGPEGLVYRVRANGDTVRIANTEERYVWALVPAARDGWFAATGAQGKVLRVRASGATQVLLDLEDTNIISLVADGHGGVYAGGDSHGTVVHIAANGTARTLFDAPQDEIRALAVGADGALYAAALSAKAVENSDNEESDDPHSLRPVKRSTPRDRAVVYRILPDSAVTEWWDSPQPVMYAMAGGAAGITVATGNRAAVYVLGGLQAATQWLNAPQGQITALDVGPKGELFAATSNPGALWRLNPGARGEGELLSPVLDAQRLSRFGRMRWHGDAGGGRIELRTRSGNSGNTDTTWTPWQGGRVGPEGTRCESPAGRYLQWKLTLAGGKPRIASVEVAWRENNVPPLVGALRIAAQAEGFRNGRLSQGTEAVTQMLEGGRRVEFSLKRKIDDRDRRDLPVWIRGLRTVQWNANDANEDPLRYRLDVRAEGELSWLPVAADLEDSVYVWDTNTIPDGRYRLRVTASDIEGNAVGEERESQAVSEAFTVDNTEPRITSFVANGETGAVRVRGAASDAGSPLWRLEVAIDDGNWRPVTPDGGLTDGMDMSFDAVIRDVAAGEHAVSFRAVDRAGNFVIRAARATVTRGR